MYICILEPGESRGCAVSPWHLMFAYTKYKIQIVIKHTPWYSKHTSGHDACVQLRQDAHRAKQDRKEQNTTGTDQRSTRIRGCRLPARTIWRPTGAASKDMMYAHHPQRGEGTGLNHNSCPRYFTGKHAKGVNL